MLKHLRFDIFKLLETKLPVRLINTTNEWRLVQGHWGTRQLHQIQYRNRIHWERASQEISNGTNKTPVDRVKQCRERTRMNTAEWINDGASTTAAGAV
ncbi:hypothetical protein TNCV_802001 [Trichonephila clavipes]|nr:hypothetical protein TNCV_802001 [Trichonephila clavipes]